MENHGDSRTSTSTTPSHHDPSTAPEVLPRDSEGLQVVDHDPHHRSPGNLPPTRQPHPHSSEKQAKYGTEGLIPLDTTEPKPDQKQHRRRRCGYAISRRALLTIYAALGILVVVAAIAGGVGGYFAGKQRSAAAADRADEGAQQSPPPITTGTSGLAALPCRATSVSPASAPQATPRDVRNPYIISANSSSSSSSSSPSSSSNSIVNITFTLTCRRDAPASLTTISRFVTYTFPLCIERCAEDDGCAGVVYGANLTDMVADGTPGANCLLKGKGWDAVADGVKAQRWMASAVRE